MTSFPMQFTRNVLIVLAAAFPFIGHAQALDVVANDATADLQKANTELTAARAEVEADRLTYESGLGATIEKLEAPVFVSSVQRIRRQMEPWGFTLKPFFHPKLGTF